MMMIRRLLFLFTIYLASCAQQFEQSSAVISGTVRDKDSSEPLSGVAVTIVPSGKSVVTGTDGIFQLSDLEPTQYSIEVTRSGYKTDKRSVIVTAGKPNPVDVLLEKDGPQLSVSPARLDFEYDVDRQIIELKNTGQGTLSWNIEPTPEWLTITPVSGQITKDVATLTVKVNRELLIEALTSINVLFLSNAGGFSLPLTVKRKIPELVVQPIVAAFGTTLANLSLTLSNGAQKGVLSYTVNSSDMPSWLKIAPSDLQGKITNQQTKQLPIVVDRNGLPANNYAYTLKFTNSFGIKNVDVSMKVEYPSVSTGSVLEKTNSTVRISGTIEKIGSFAIKSHGHCWSKTVAPTVEACLGKTDLAIATQTGTFYSNLTNLELNQTYYVRSYVIADNNQAFYGSEISFLIEQVRTPLVEITSISTPTSNSVSVSGNVTDDGNATVTARGFCYSKTIKPTLQNSIKAVGSGKGAFSAELTSLESGTTYYLRAYATNSQDTAYSEEQSFTTSTVPQGTMYVSVSGNDSNDGSSWSKAKKTIANALDNIGSKTKIWMSVGVFDFSPLTITGISVYGGFLGTETSESQRNLSETNTTRLKNAIQISNGKIDGCVLEKSLSLMDKSTMENCSALALTWNYGINNKIVNCSMNSIYHYYVTGEQRSLTVLNSTFFNCSDDIFSAAGRAECSIEFYNCLFVQNYKVGWNKGGEKMKFVNCTFANNRNCFWAFSESEIEVYNSIFYKAGTDEISFGGKITKTNCIETQDNSLVKFINPVGATGNWRLSSGSSAIDKGLNIYFPYAEIRTDLSGDERIKGSSIDLGAYEY